MSFCHLHLHTEHSLLDGVGSAKQYAERARALGQTYLACTDHGNVDGLLKFQKACWSCGVTPVLGVELYMVPDLRQRHKDERRYHIVALMASEEGLSNVLRMLSIANLDGFYKRPRIDPATLLAHRDGLVFATACVSSFVSMPGGVDLLLELNRTNTVCLEVMPHDHPAQKATNLQKAKLSNAHNIPMVATADCHYPLPGNITTQEVLLAIQRKKRWTDSDRFSMSDWKLHMRSEEEMAAEFEAQGVLDRLDYLQAMENTVALAELCNGFSIGRRDVLLPKVRGHEGRDETELLWELVKRGFSERIAGSIDPGPYHQRMVEEMEQVCRMGFQRYFLIVWELVSWCRSQGIMTGPGRGSSGGSLVCYLLYITDVDPVRYGLIFARFISPERNDLPDIDMDFEDERREDVRRHLEECYGHYNVAGISTFMTMKGRGALRDVARVFGIGQDEVDRAAKSIETKPDGDPRAGHTIEDSCKSSEELRAFQARHPDVVRMAMELEGKTKSVGQHAAAVCISSDDLREGRRCSLCVRDSKLVANWDKDDAEHMGLMKLDILGLSSLTLLNYARQLIKDSHGVDIRFDKVPLDDQRVYEEVNAGHSVGAFQLGTNLLIRLCKDMGVSEFNDLVVANALGRPGPLGAGMVDEYIARKRGRKPVSFIHPRLEPYTRETLGIVIYQEQVMWAMHKLAGLPWGVCDKVRKVMGKSRGVAEFQQFKEQFVGGCSRQGTLPPADASHVWDMLASFSGYGFVKAHAVEYSLIGYWTLWLKFNWTKEFMAALLTHGGAEHKQQHVNEARRLGLRIQLPRMGESAAGKWRPSKSGNMLCAPFMEIKGIGESQAAKIEGQGARQGGNTGFFRMDSGTHDLSTLGDSIGDLLRKCGADGRGLTEEEAAEAQQYFGFNIKDKRSRFRRLYELDDRKWADMPEESLLRCELSGVSLIRLARHIRKVECSSCQLRQSARAPVSPSPGRYNVMVIGEAPGLDEDAQGMGFVGRAGHQVLWPEMAKHGLSALMFHVTNVVKCYPGKDVKLSRKHVEACRGVLEAEMADLRPIAVLAFGNTGVRFFTGSESGITELSGKTEWSDRFGCWVCWGVHPAAVLHSAANRRGFEEGIRNFAEVLKRIGGRSQGLPSIGGSCPYGGKFSEGNNNYLECESCPEWQPCAVTASCSDWVQTIGA